MRHAQNPRWLQGSGGDYLRRLLWCVRTKNGSLWLLYFFAGAYVVSARNIQTVLPDSVLGLDISPVQFLQHIFSTYSSSSLGHRINGSEIAYLPMALFYAICSYLSGSILFTQQMWFSLLLALAAFGMMKLFQEWWSESAVLPGVLAGVLYSVSPYVLLNLQGASSLIIPYAAAPWFAWSGLRLVRSEKLRNIILFVVIGGILGVGVNPPLTLLLWFVGITISIWELSGANWSRRKGLRLVGAMAGLLVVSTW